jgi:hypothetical protein
MNELQSDGHAAKVSRPLSELNFLVMQAEREKEKRRLVIATLEALLGRSFEKEFRSCRSSGVAECNNAARRH